MIIQNIKTELLNTRHPVAKAIHKSEHGRTLVIGFLKNMVLKSHQSHLPSTLLVIEGKLLYRDGNKEIIASALEEIQIPVNVMHDVTALEDSISLLIQG